MVKTAVYLGETVTLKRMAQAQRRPQGQWIRETLTRLTDSAVSHQPQGLGIFASGDKANSATYRTRLKTAMRAGKW